MKISKNVHNFGHHSILNCKSTSNISRRYFIRNLSQHVHIVNITKFKFLYTPRSFYLYFKKQFEHPDRKNKKNFIFYDKHLPNKNILNFSKFRR